MTSKSDNPKQYKPSLTKKQLNGVSIRFRGLFLLFFKHCILKTILTINYLGSVQYWAHLIASDHVLLEQNCFFNRQTYRNRCHILGSNGLLPLSIPIVKPLKNITKTRDAQISYDTAWQPNHWKSIESAYRNTPYFEYYADDYEKEFHKKHKYLLDFDMTLMAIIVSHLDVDCRWEATEQYHNAGVFELDMREMIHPKKGWQDDLSFEAHPYHQVFADKFGFTPNLSVLDLIFNKGPESKEHLLKCIKKG